MKNPNGYGTVVKYSGKRRRPYCARVTVGWVDGKQKTRALGYYATQRQALAALQAYNESPEELTRTNTFAEVYSGWHADKFYGDYSLEKEKNYAKAYANCAAYHDTQFNTIRLAALQALCDSLPTYEQAYRVRTLVSQMSEWAIKRDIAVKNYAEAVEIKQKRSVTRERRRFTRDEIERVAAFDSRVASIVLILIYTGCRISELLDLRREDVIVEPDGLTLSIRKSKTDAGVRLIPVHSRIEPLVRAFYDEGCERLVTTVRRRPWTYNNWQTAFGELMSTLDMDHCTHETRHTFISLLAEAHVDPTFIKKLCGHSSAQSLTEAVYTHLSTADLRREIEDRIALI